MIDEMYVENLALIVQATLTPGAGLTVLTGETGAGKTALLSALKLMMGERADASWVREGASSAQVRGRFFVNEHDTEGMVVERRIGADGRSRIRIDGAASSVGELSDRMHGMLDLCGQHDQHGLLDMRQHVAMVDAWGHEQIAGVLAAYQEALKKAEDAAAAYQELQERVQTEGAHLEDARFSVERIDEVQPQPGELEELEELLPRVEHAESLIMCAEDARAALQEENGALDALQSALAELTRMARVDSSLQAFVDTLTEAAISVEDVVSDLSRYRDAIDFDPAALARAQERASELKGLMRSFGPTMDDVFQKRAQAAELLRLCENRDQELSRAQLAVDEAEAELATAARKLTLLRNKLAPRFCRAVQTHMQSLEMASAELVWESRELPRSSWTRMGAATGEFLYRSGAGLTPRPLRRIASGGELSRVLLAAKLVLGAADKVDTLVFDEVDAGVGGAVARSLARVIKNLACTHQVLVVTHLAQIAVMAEKHLLVQKHEGDLPVTTLTELDYEERVQEIARMLSGEVSELSCAHARKLLDEAAGV
ncbi:DNA repair protein RecN [Collinsella sp. zg1085]|uniref:DNA repair protein RecN n=1 Tax=Collinsella sp. zg1085 TaxID=2844380 RepID=UPI001C0E75C2|nr:DNA repair protein RecN [Collinsella sp. zg1085]QWT17075.1 DNA repair protein RecN [Collinsella sp. zg1085]